MNASPVRDRALRRSVYGLLIILSAATMTGRILTVRSELGKTPLLGANDRSRWSTIRALVDEGTYQIDDVIFDSRGRKRREWYSIDMVRHRGWDGREHYYSSKPPLLATLLAGKYWLIQQMTGLTLAQRPFYVGRLILWTTNVLPLLLYFIVLAALLERFGRTDWGRVFVMAAATAGTFLTAFAVTLNNHLPAAISVLLACYAAVRIIWDDRREYRYFAGAGAFAALAATNELPALSFCALLGLLLLWREPGRTLLGFLPGLAVVAAAFFATNYAAHGSWRPPYAHRQEGPVVGRLPIGPLEPGESVVAAPPPGALTLALPEINLSADAELTPTATPGRWLVWDPVQQRRWALLQRDEHWEVRAWDNWYDYEGSYWTGPRSGVDRGEPLRAVYACHMLLGHRGVFSLTPIWLLTIIGLTQWLRGDDRRLQCAAGFILLLSILCILFYVTRPQIDRNYGGVAAGFRWLFWFTPLWLLAALPAADAASQTRHRRLVAWLALAISVFSATYAWQNPWSHSWLFDYWSHLGWISY